MSDDASWIQWVLNCLVGIQVAAMGWLVKILFDLRKTQNEDRAAAIAMCQNLEGKISNTYVPRAELEERARRHDDRYEQFQRDHSDTKESISRIHDRIDSILELLRKER